MRNLMGGRAGFLVLAGLALGCDPGSDPADGAGNRSGALSEWERGRSSELPRIEAAGAMVDGRLIVVSGFATTELEATTRVDAYDPDADRWTRLADAPTGLTHANLAVEGRTLWLAGGFVGTHPGPTTDEVWKYDLDADTWSAGPRLPEPRGGGVLVRREGFLHYFGGFLSDRNTNSADHWVLELPVDSGAEWRSAAPLPAARGQLGAVAIDGLVYAVGGQFFHDTNPGPVDVDLVHVYDPDEDAWQRLASLPSPRSHAEGATFVHHGRIVVAGGRDFGTDRWTVPEVTLYDPDLDVWIALPPLPVALLGPTAGSTGEGLVVHGGSTEEWNTPSADVWRRTLARTWERRAPMSAPLAEVSAGIIGQHMYVVGGGNPGTLAYDLSRDEWGSSTALSLRPFQGDHHAAEVLDGRLYLFGGFGRSAGRTQIYDPATDRWEIGADMPFAAGSSASAVIDGRIYLAGGIVGDSTTGAVARYDAAADAWTLLTSMPEPRNHAASATDGDRLWVFGGRGPGSGDANVVANGYADVQVYDPATDSWETSFGSDASLPPLPQARGGMGKAVFLDGRFYVMGGETRDGPGATDDGVYDRVDVYDPAAGRWHTAPPMPTARHGIFPVVVADRIYVAGGGDAAGASRSDILEVYNPDSR